MYVRSSAAAAACLCERTRYRKRPPMVRKGHSVPKTGSYGTQRIFRGIRCKKQASTVRKRYSVPKTGSSGTRRIFKGPQNSRLHRLWTASCRTRRIFRGVPCQKQHLAAPDASSVRGTASARRRANIKRGCSSKSIKTLMSTLLSLIVLYSD